MFRAFLMTYLAAVFCLPAAATPPRDEGQQVAVHRAAMQKVAFLVGDWEGGGSILLPGAERQTFRQNERIQLKHDGTLLLIEGNGKSPETGTTVHDALAVVTFDSRSGGYKFRSFAAVGRYADTDASVNGNTFVWNLNFPQQKIRYTITVADGVWREIGERSADGATWTPFFEMTLKKK